MKRRQLSRAINSLSFLHILSLIILIFSISSINAQIRTDSAKQSNDLVNRQFRKVPIPPGIKTDFDKMLISRFGGVWAKSQSSGLAYFDGTEMKIYRHSKTDSNTISSDVIRSIAEDQVGNLYAATINGSLNIINKTTNRITKIIFRDSIEQLKNAMILSLYLDNQNNLFIGLLGRGFLRYNTVSGSVKHFNLDLTKPDSWYMLDGNSTSMMQEDPTDKNIIWMMSSHGHLYSFNKVTQRLEKTFGQEITYGSTNMFTIGKEDIFLTSNINRIYNKKTNQVRSVKRFKDWGYVTPYKKSDSVLYCYYNSSEVVTYNIHSDSYTSCKLPSFGLSETSRVSSFMSDEKDNIWMIADGELYYSSKQYSLFSNFVISDKTILSKVADGAPNVISDIKWDPVNHWYYLFYFNWIYVLNEKFEPIRTIDLLNLPPRVLPIRHSIVVDNNSRLWILTDTLHIWDKTKEKALPYPQYFGKEFPAVKGNIASIAKGSNNLLYLYTNEHNLYSLETNTFRLEFLANLTTKDNEDLANIGVGGITGYDSSFNKISLYTLSLSNRYLSIFDIPSHKIYHLSSPAFTLGKVPGSIGCFDTDGYFWTKGANPILYKLDQEMKIVDSVTSFPFMLPEDIIVIELVGKDSLMIVSTECYIFHTKKRIVTLINADNGVLKQRMAGNYSFVNRHIFYSAPSLLQYAPINKFQNVPGKPQVYIAGMKLGNNKFEMPVSVPRLKYDQNNLSFVMSAVEMDFPERVQYAYRLVNFMDDWTFTDFYNRNIVYTNLPPGKFILQIKARTLGQEWEETKSFAFTIIPPFWQTWWFRTLAALLLIGMVFLFIRSRIALVRKKEQQKTFHEKELLDLEAKALRAQMNPHFIFNSLNSIKSLINKNENEKAANYLTTFSKLIRTLFQNSDKREVSLFEEIETCKLYTQLERMRFGDKIRFVFDIDESIDLKDIKVPALILQPLIENAIWHGLVPKETGGTIFFSVKENNGGVECTIDDDGIGRELSNQYKAQYRATHESKGIGMTQSRLELDKLLNEREDSIRIIDKIHGAGKAEGTKVIVTFKENGN